ncbi:hypothetical protein SAMN04488542_11090 [Fontibacillus panacisegetis]|uniref:Permuted papain-like amidase enzyme, YaeF/YiiX, C92 family n=1 Tax=Fontibacillus panacisegetis TaxID=670482 RepID=A0A1G7KWJ4_9BACL|nr:hypothetical protein [Fontibacillus panacisegetis]SDF41119.1 hypothetical protein SAMN04488542_11090 [Fontibacillus panacisegetis]
MKKDHQIFILLSNPTTIIAKMIGLYTKAPYNHASIAFDPELRELYSFGRKHPIIPVIGGFIKEDIHSGFFERATCAVYSCSVSKDTYDKMRSYVKQVEENNDMYGYNFLGILGIVLNLELGGERSFFCSQFVCSVFQTAGVQLLDKSAGLTTPEDLSNSSYLKLDFRGNMETYRRIYCYRTNVASPIDNHSLYIAN